MNLLIHDLDREEWEKIADKYEGWNVISDDGSIRSCVGCFGCWTRTPGECVIKDGYNRMGALVHEADEMLVMTKYTYGGFSSFVKNVFDRSIGWVMPFFEIRNGEMHHKTRYPEEKPIRVIFRGGTFSEEDKERAVKYVNAVCMNFHGVVKEILFEESEKAASERTEVNQYKISDKMNALENSSGLQDKTLMINCSFRGDKANSARFLDRMGTMISGDKERINLSSYADKEEDLISNFMSAKRVVLGMPLYVDGIPAAPLRMMEKIEKITGGRASVSKEKKIYLICNMGFYESAQLVNLVGMVKCWCKSCGFEYSGCIAIGSGEMLGPMIAAKNIEKGPTADLSNAFRKMSDAINSDTSTDDIYVGPGSFPRSFYMMAANFGMRRNGRKNGLTGKDMYRRL